MATLLLRIAAPLQSWGSSSKFEVRKTENVPTKSGIIGLLAAALGRRRDESLEDLNRLRFGVRVDQEGKLLRDFHMVHGEKASYLTTRYYMADAVFVAALESDDMEFLKKLEQAVKNPAFPLFLGRRSCPPTQPLVLGIREEKLISALREESWQVAEWRRNKLDSSLRILADCSSEEEGAAAQQDVPLSFHPERREYGYRMMKEYGYVNKGEAGTITEHDPMKELRGEICI